MAIQDAIDALNAACARLGDITESFTAHADELRSSVLGQMEGCDKPLLERVGLAVDESTRTAGSYAASAADQVGQQLAIEIAAIATVRQGAPPPLPGGAPPADDSSPAAGSDTPSDGDGPSDDREPAGGGGPGNAAERSADSGTLPEPQDGHPGGGSAESGTGSSSSEFSLSEEEANAVKPKRREHEETRQKWRELAVILNQHEDPGVRHTVAGWLGVKLDFHGFVVRDPVESGFEYPAGHAFEKHEGQVSFDALLARVLWQRGPNRPDLDADGEREVARTKEGVGPVATSYTSPVAFLRPLVAFAERTWSAGGTELRWQEVLEAAGTEVLLAPDSCGYQASDVHAARGARATTPEGEAVDFSTLRRRRVRYPDQNTGVVITAEACDGSILTGGSCVLRFRRVGTAWRLVTQFPEPNKPPEVR